MKYAQIFEGLVLSINYNKCMARINILENILNEIKLLDISEFRLVPHLATFKFKL